MSAQNNPECEIYKKKPECEFSQNLNIFRIFVFEKNECRAQYSENL